MSTKTHKRTTRSTKNFWTPVRVREGILKSMAVIWIIIASIATIIFSANGVSEFFYGDEFVQALGFIMGFGVFFFQLYLYQGFTENKMLLLISIIAFVYSIWSTWVGLLGTTDWEVISNNSTRSIVMFVFALLFDLTPEPLLMFVLFGREGLKQADALGSFFDWIIPGNQSNWYKKRSFSFPGKSTKQPPKSKNIRELQKEINGV